MINRNALVWLALTFALLFVSACEIDPKTNYQTRYAVHSGSHVVEEGESLLSIAGRYHQDFQELARRNGIRYPYWIFPGQIISLNDNSASRYRFSESRQDEQVTAYPTRFPARQLPDETRYYARSPEQATSLDWGWPIRGRVIETFSQGGASPGIDIAANSGDQVVAAADGEVKYLGEQVRGLGKVVILSHGGGYVSVYAHNRRFLTQNRRQVKKGDVIAVVGIRPNRSTALHFQVRFNGKPVDPMIFLP